MLQALPKNSVGFILVLEMLAAIAAVIFFGLEIWVPVGFVVLGWWLLAQYKAPALAMIACNLWLGIAFAELIFAMPPPWVSSMLGAVAVAFVSLGFSRGGNPETETSSGDQNVIPPILAIITTRAFLALKYATISEVTFTTNPLQWLGLFVFGAVPDAPTIFNLIFVVALQGTLIIYLVLMIKRLTNLVAN